MPDDPIFVALRQGRVLSLEVAEAAKRYRLSEIDELWAEVRILEQIIEGHPGLHSALAERDPPIEASERTHH